MGDTFDKFNERTDRGRGRLGDHEAAPERKARGPRVTGASDLCDLDLYLRNDNPAKLAIAVAPAPDTAFAKWVWLPRSLIEYDKTGAGKVRVTLPEHVAVEKGLA